MLTVKKDSSSFSTVFNKKCFFVDSNIVFRLAGFNKKERQLSIDAFIRKCNKAGIKICYTNHTNFELITTISHYVEMLKKTLGSKPPISVEAVNALSSKYANLDFYEKYYEWCKSPKNKAGDYNAFREFLEKEIRKVISSFQLVVAEDFGSQNSFRQFSEDFTSYKSHRYKNTYEGAIKVDVNNFLYLLKVNEDGQASNFLDLKNYFITADHCLTEWASSKRPGTVPIFVLPSVWYSILLKYKGRTDDDYLAFCQFLNIRIAPEQDLQLDAKRMMLAYVMELDEEVKIKEEVIFDIEKRLSSGDVTIEDSALFAEESHQTITQSRVDEAERQVEDKYVKKLQQQIQESEEQKKEQLEEGKKEGFSNGQNNIIERQAALIVKRNKAIRIVSLSIFILCLIVLMISIIFTFFINTNCHSIKLLKFFDDHAIVIDILASIIGAIAAAINTLAKMVNFLSVDEEIIKKSLREKYGI